MKLRLPNQPTVVVFTGGRDYRDREAIKSVISSYPVGTIIIHGAADGADTICHELCGELGLIPWPLPYFHWLGKNGGGHRNHAMVRIAAVLQAFKFVGAGEAFPGPKSVGTWNCVRHIWTMMRVKARVHK